MNELSVVFVTMYVCCGGVSVCDNVCVESSVCSLDE